MVSRNPLVRVLRKGGWAAVSVSTTPERSLFARVGPVIARHVPDRAAKLNRFFSIPSEERLRSFIGGTGFCEVDLQREAGQLGLHRSNPYFSGIEKGATLSGQEFVRLSPDLKRRDTGRGSAGTRLGVADISSRS
jgi:hypothetical protein